MTKKKARPGDLRLQMNRIRKSREKLKIHNREKTALNKKLRDRNVELTENRNHWKTRSKELHCQNENLEQRLQMAREETERERMRADQERERANRLEAEIKGVWEKKSRT